MNTRGLTLTIALVQMMLMQTHLKDAKLKLCVAQRRSNFHNNEAKEQTNEGEEGTYMEFVEEDCVSGTVSSRFCRFPELFLCGVSVHRTQSEKAVWGK